MERVNQLRQALPDSFQILSGDDSLTLPFMSVGAVGVISVASNIIPAEVSRMVRHHLEGESTKALEIHQKYYPLFKDLFIEPNPVPAKFVLARLGKMSSEVRLPLCEMTPASVQRLTETLNRLGL